MHTAAAGHKDLIHSNPDYITPVVLPTLLHTSVGTWKQVATMHFELYFGGLFRSILIHTLACFMWSIGPWSVKGDHTSLFYVISRSMICDGRSHNPLLCDLYVHDLWWVITQASFIWSLGPWSVIGYHIDLCMWSLGLWSVMRYHTGLFYMISRSMICDVRSHRPVLCDL